MQMNTTARPVLTMTLTLALVSAACQGKTGGGMESAARDTTAPPAGAAPLNATVPCDPLPPVTLLGFKVREVRVTAGGGGGGGGGCAVPRLNDLSAPDELF